MNSYEFKKIKTKKQENKMTHFLILLGLLIATINCTSFHRQKPSSRFHESKVSFINYAFKNEDRIEVRTIVTNAPHFTSDCLNEPDCVTNQNWLAKAFFDGDNYNSTGYDLTKII